MQNTRPAGSTTRAVIVGAGLMGRWHSDAAVRAGAAVVGVHDVDPGVCRALASRCGATAHTDLIRSLEDETPDIVHVCTPLATHRAIAEQALERGIHVIIEKPLAASPEETEALIALASERRALLCPVHQLAFQRWHALLPRVGEFLDVRYSTCSAGAHGEIDAESNRVADEILSHPLSLFERICPGSLEEARWTASRPAPGELRAHSTASGVSLALSISMNGRPTSHELRVTGVRGTLHVDLFHGFGWIEGNHASRIYKIARPFAGAARQFAAASRNLIHRAWSREFAYPGLRELIDAVYAELRGAGPQALSTDHIRRVARAQWAIGSTPLESARGIIDPEPE